MAHFSFKWHGRRAVQGLLAVAAAVAVTVAAFAIAMPSAFAAVSVGVSPTFPATVTIGQTGVAAAVQINNASTPPDNNITINTIDLVPACGTLTPVAGGDCPSADADPGIFTVSSTAIGQADTGCAGDTFSVTIVDASTGQVSFTPSSPVVLSGSGSLCVLDFTLNVNKAPANPSSTPSADVYQVGTIASISATSPATGTTTTAFGGASTNIDKAAPGLATSATATATVGNAISDTATLSAASPPGPSPTGTITISAYGPGNLTCTGTPSFTSSVVVSGAGTYPSTPFTATDAGTYYWVATYSGDTNNAAVANACGATGEASTVTVATPTLVTTASASTTVGQTISDTATLSGGTSPTGTITFSAYGPNNPTCSGDAAFTSNAPVSEGNGNYSSGPFTVTAAGTYDFVASYSGDANNASVSSACGAPNESTVVTESGPTIATEASPSVALGGAISDTATLSGGVGPTGTIRFSVYGPNNSTCTGTATFTSNTTVSGNGSYSSASFRPTAAGTYQFVASYSGDANNGAAVSPCGAFGENVMVTPPVPAAGTYTPVAPARDLDTRNGTGGVSGPIAGNTTFALKVAGVNGVPATGVGAVALNVTVTAPTCAAYLTVFPAGQPVPTTSNLNYTAGETVPNLVVVGVGSGGQVSFNVPAGCAGHIQVIADIQGWYATQSATPAPGTYTALTPARDLDTRNGTGGTVGPVHGNTTFNLTVAGVNGVPAPGVGAVALNVTVTAPTCAAYLTVFPTGQPVPATSNLNYTAGETVANLVVVGVSSGGQVSFNVASGCAGNVQVIADVQGWYASQSGTPADGTYTALAPGRDLDTRNGTGGVTGPIAGNTTFSLKVTGVNGVPATGVGAVALNVTVTAPTCAAYLTVYPTGQTLPATSNLNYIAGQTVPNLVIVGVGTGGQVSFNVPSGCTGSIQVIADIQGWYGPTV